MLKILEILVILIVLLFLFNYNKQVESFNGSNSGIGSTHYFYNKRVESPFQIGKTYIPYYNYPTYGRNYLYNNYNYFFNPFNSSIY